MSEYRAFRIHNDNGRHRAGIEALPLQPPAKGEVLIRTRFSSVNFKDALAGTGRGKILRSFPLTGGIDSAGEVAQSADPRFKEGDQVLVTGCGLSETCDGGYAEWLRVAADAVVPLPAGLGPFEAMAIGTAGFAAALALHRMEQNGQRPDQGAILITGASGGVGTLATDIFSHRGYAVTAVTGKQAQRAFLRSLGAAQIIGRDELALGERPLEQARWAGAVDTVGGEVLAGLTRHIQPWGNIASIGLAAGAELHTSVMPFIIRGISLLGINSAGCPYPLRRQLWQRLGAELKPPHLEEIVDRVIRMEELPKVFEEMLAGRGHGRTVVMTAETA